MPGLEMEERQVKVTLKKRVAARKNKNQRVPWVHIGRFATRLVTMFPCVSLHIGIPPT